jgi:hypothetical protein
MLTITPFSGDDDDDNDDETLWQFLRNISDNIIFFSALIFSSISVIAEAYIVYWSVILINCFLTNEFKDDATELLPLISFVFLRDEVVTTGSVVDDICCLKKYKIKGLFILYHYISLL